MKKSNNNSNQNVKIESLIKKENRSKTWRVSATKYGKMDENCKSNQKLFYKVIKNIEKRKWKEYFQELLEKSRRDKWKTRIT